MKRIIAALLLVPAIAFAQVTTNPTTTGVQQPQNNVNITGGTISGTTITSTSTMAGTTLVKVGTLTRVANATNGSVSYTGVGFTPTSIQFWAEGNAAGLLGIGIASASAQFSSALEAGVSQGTDSSNAIWVSTAANTQWLKGAITSMDADGFTIAWTHTSLGATTVSVNYIARR